MRIPRCPRTATLWGACVALLAMESLVHAATYSVVSDFSLSNPSGVWSYGYGYGAWAGSLTVAGSNSEFEWWSIGDYPYVERNISGADITGSGATIYILPIDHLIMVPGNYWYGILRFTAPTAGTFTFSGDFMQLEDHTRTTSWEGAVITSGTTTTTAMSGNLGGPGWLGKTVDISFLANLVPGDTVDFMVSSQGDNWGDDIGLKLIVNEVPEAGAIILAAGSAVILLTGRRSRR